MITAQRIANDLASPAFRWAPASAREVCIALGLVCTLSSALAVAQAGFDWFPFPVWHRSGWQMPGLLFNSVHQGQTLALMVVALFAHRLYWLIPGILPGLYLAHSRGAWLALAVGLFASKFRYPLALLILVLAAGVFYTGQVSTSDSQRLQIWAAAWTHLTLWGHGLGSFHNLFIGHPGAIWQPQYVHNDFLQTVFEFGVLAVIPFSFVAWAASRTSARDWPTLVTFLVVACYSMPLAMPIMLTLFILALAGAFHA